MSHCEITASCQLCALPCTQTHTESQAITTITMVEWYGRLKKMGIYKYTQPRAVLVVHTLWLKVLWVFLAMENAHGMF